MPSNRDISVDPQDFVRALRDPGRNMKEKYKGKPLELADKLGVKLPRKPVAIMIELGVITEEEAEERFGKQYPGIRELVEDVCSLEVTDAVVVGARGSGKSFGVSYIEFYLWIICDFDALNLGGSEIQADNVYQYMLGYIDSDGYWRTLIRGDTMKEKTFTVEDAWVRVLTASQKSTRSPHAGGLRKGKVRGGILVIDEEGECDPDIVQSALPTVNTAIPSVNVRLSTFHKLGGSFQDVVDNHEEMGYKLYKTDIFDVCSGCDCVDVCQSEEPCFREDHFTTVVNPDTGETERKLVHKAYCGGRAIYSEGWIPMTEIVKLWRRMKRNHSTWEVEAMGSRPSSSGYVIKDQTRFSANIVSETGMELFLPGSPIEIDVDWGTGAAGIEVWQEQPGDRHVLIVAEQITDNSDTQMIGAINGYVQQFLREFQGVAADIGGGGNYLNPKLVADYGLEVRDVNFAEEKESAAAALNIYNDAGLILIPEEHVEFISQARKWKRGTNGRILKGNDHLMDTALCYFSKFVERLGLPRMAIPPKSFSSQMGGRSEPNTAQQGPRKPIYGHTDLRPLVRTFGSGRKGRR